MVMFMVEYLYGDKIRNYFNSLHVIFLTYADDNKTNAGKLWPTFLIYVFLKRDIRIRNNLKALIDRS